jgi:hypothetical protein
LDLSAPDAALETLVQWLELIQTRTEDCLRELRARNENKKIDNIKSRNVELYKDHKDK